jgi:protein SCO1/2
VKRLASWLGISLLVIWGPRCAAQPAPEPPEVGLEEKLGEIVPARTRLVDETGGGVELGKLLGKPTILTLNYFRCASVCSPQLNGVASALNGVALEPGRDFQVLTVSFDPRDTPGIAKKKRENYLKLMNRPFPPSAWRFLTGAEEATRSLADSVGYRFAKQGGEYAHPAAIMILSPEGQVTRYLYGTRFLRADVEMALREAAQGLARPTVTQPLGFCYVYDPMGRRYVFSVTRAAGTMILVLGVVFAVALLARSRRRAQAP